MQRLLLACFFLSGVSGLIYEVVWTRKLALILGSTTLSVSLSLAAYLGGMALGSYLWGRFSDRLKKPAHAYGAMEVGIGCYGVLSLWVLDAVGPAYVSLQAAFDLSGFSLNLLQFVLVAAGLLVPTVLMGGTLPVLVRTTPVERSGLGARVGRLYAANTAGAVVGASLTGFVLLPQIGLQHSILVAAVTNVTLGLVVLVASRRRTQPTAFTGSTVESVNAPERSSIESAMRPAVINLIVFNSGFCVLFYEVVWTRALDLVLGSSTQAFSLMLTTFLLGLSGGIAVGGRLARRDLRGPSTLFVAHLAAGLTIFLTGCWLPLLPRWFVILYTMVGDHPILFIMGQAGLCAVILLIPTVLMGTIFPLAIESANAAEGREGRQVGRFYALNTFGCILGAFLAGLVLIPTLGMYQSLLLGMWLYFGLSTLLGFVMPDTGLTRRAARFGIPLALAAILTAGAPAWNPLLMTTGVYFYVAEVVKVGMDRFFSGAAQALLVFYREGPTGTVTVREKGLHRFLSIDGRVEGNLLSSAQVFLGHLPFAFDRSLQDVFIIGLGTGSTAGAVTLHPVRHVDVVEIEPAVFEASSLFESVNHRPLADPRVRARVGDARNILAVSPPASYDLIISQPSVPWVSGSSKLFTVEFYRLAQSHLRPHGILAQWVQLYNMEYSSVQSLIKTFTSVFPQTLVIEVGTGAGEVVLIGSTDPILMSWDALARMYSDPVLAKELTRISVPSPGAVLARLLLGPREIPAVAADLPTNTDDNGLIEFATMGSLYRNTTAANLKELRRAAASPWIYVAGVPEGMARQAVLIEMAETARLEADYPRALSLVGEALQLGGTAEAHRVRGNILYAQGPQEDGIKEWNQALALDPTNSKALGRLVGHYGKMTPSARPPEFQSWCARLPDEREFCRPTTTSTRP